MGSHAGQTIDNSEAEEPDLAQNSSAPDQDGCAQPRRQEPVAEGNDQTKPAEVHETNDRQILENENI